MTIRTFTAALAVLAIAVPAAQAQQDLRSPDARDAGRTVVAPAQDLRSPDARDAGRTVVASPQDLRSPDARDAGRTVVAPQQDLRSPDARDAARDRAVPVTPRTTLPSYPVALPPEPASPVATEGGAEWGTIGLAGAVTLLAAGGLALVLARRSRRAHRMGATA
jgi:hypothetical protein